MSILVLDETLADEQRVALSPESVKKLTSRKARVVVEAGAGLAAGFEDAEYRDAGATVATGREALLGEATVLLAVGRPPLADVRRLRPGAVVVGFLDPLGDPAAMAAYAEAGVTALAVELVPRITRAQAMDALSSMATVVGYKAVLLAAQRLPRMFPLLMTAAGTVAPARVLVVGAGVAGLSAIATARRLGARVSAYDVRAAAGEQVRSLGATFLEVDLGGIQTEDAGGYARELTEEALLRGRHLVAEHARTSDVVITSAQIPGRRAPVMLLTEAVQGMRPGSVVVDLAGATGGNCLLTRPGESYATPNRVVMMSPLNLAASVPYHASQLYGRNLTSLLELMMPGGELKLDLSDEILAGACVTHAGKIHNARVAASLSQGGHA